MWNVERLKNSGHGQILRSEDRSQETHPAVPAPLLGGVADLSAEGGRPGWVAAFESLIALNQFAREFFQRGKAATKK
jgi:hypothetical protein